MAALIRKKNSSDLPTRWKSAGAFVFACVGLILALASYHPEDPSLNTFSASWVEPQNVLGYFGSWIADIFYQLFGYTAWLWPILWGSSVIRWAAGEDKTEPVFHGRDWGGLCVALCSVTLFIALFDFSTKGAGFPPAGLLGIAISKASIPLLGTVGSYFLATFALWFACMMWWEELPFYLFRAVQALAEKVSLPKISFLGAFNKFTANAVEARKARKEARAEARAEKLATKEAAHLAAAEAVDELDDVDDEFEEEDEDSEEYEYEFSEDDEEESFEEDGTTNRPTLRVRSPKADQPARERKRPKASRSADEVEEWETPPLSLLQAAKTKIKGPTEDQLFQTADRITSALQSFDIDGEVVEVSPGPIITMYEFQPAPGVRVNKLVSAATDLAMTLGVPSVRVVAPIPGKCVAGIEVPNATKQEIVLKDVYENTMNRASSFKLPMIFGVDNEGNPVCEDLARMPHLLVGGATNMGKSVLVNSLMTGLLLRFTPEELKLIVVDPKLVEFKVFEDIPHLLLPIVNDPADASQALKWAVAETKRRYLEMQKISAKNLEAYNKKIDEGALEDGERMPYIVIVIDELAELMLTAKKDVEQSIVRLSQLARAAGIHLIMATQRPSADVVTGLIKSNCPSRASLRVASASDSRIILDCSGAEQLLGRGDMFFTNAGPMGLKRMQGCYVSDEEIERICDFWREQGEPSYREEILNPEDDLLAKIDGDSEDVDKLFSEVMEFAREKGKISTSLIQRRFQIGYTRAARIMDQLEERGIAAEASSAGKPRDVIL